MTSIRTLACVAAILMWGQGRAAEGLALRLEGGGARDFLIASNVWLYVAAGASPSPLLPTGSFVATWTGSVRVDLRSEYRFQADVAGLFELEINGLPVLKPRLSAGLSEWSEPVRLRKGTNVLRATLRREGAGEARVRLSWTGRGVPPEPVPFVALAHEPSSDPVALTDAALASEVRLGRGLFLRYRCGRCHTPDTTSPVPELGADAPAFHGIGSRRREAWMARWIANPRNVRHDAIMPRLPQLRDADADARAMAAWLASLRTDAEEIAAAAPLAGLSGIGHALFDSLHCTACHERPSEAGDSSKVSLRRVGEKFVDGALTAFLRQPDRHYGWTPMPRYALSEAEAEALAAWILQDAPPQPSLSKGETDSTEIGRGRDLVQTLGCLNCHFGPGENRATAPALRDIRSASWERGCLAGEGAPESGAPRFAFSPAERRALRAFGASDRASLGRHVPREFAERWSAELRCAACHDALETLPRLARAGEKLRPEWAERLFRGDIDYKPRPWLQARMPAFPVFAAPLAEGYAAAHGLPNRSPSEPPIDETAAADGRRLVSASGGFSCVTCHAVGPFGATAVFEAPGINLVHSGERLFPDYFVRWLRNPQAIEPGTKMPLYFDDDGNSALSDFYGGDGPKTIRALWEYVRFGPRMEPPLP